VSGSIDLPFIGQEIAQYEDKTCLRSFHKSFLAENRQTAITRLSNKATDALAVDIFVKSFHDSPLAHCAPAWDNIHAGTSAGESVGTLFKNVRSPSDDTYRFILHDHAIFSPGFDDSLAHLDLEIITTPVRSPQANALCERLIGGSASIGLFH
jgi:hypothetical protein